MTPVQDLDNMEPLEGGEVRRGSRTMVAVIVYISLFLDNMLLTVIVPILPDYLVHFSAAMPESLLYKNFDLHYVPKLIGAGGGAAESTNDTLGLPGVPALATIESENGAIGMLLAVKALVQLIANPIVGSGTAQIGYAIPIAFGTGNLLVAAVIFGFGTSYGSLFVARAIHGVGSACIGVCGMSLVAQLYVEEERRSKVMGTILGAIAVGVLVGYPFGGIAYEVAGKAAPFHILAVLCAGNLLLQCYHLDLSYPRAEPSTTTHEQARSSSSWWSLLTNRLVLLIAGGIWISTSAMAILEPCLPIWMIENLHPKRWQLGTVFIPDSIGYWIGTNFFGTVAYKLGQIRVSIAALALVGISCVLIPASSNVAGLLLPHFGLGLGIGVLDAALVPLLATLVDGAADGDNSDSSCYGTVYAIQQIAVSLAYSLAPMLGGELVPLIGFPVLLRIMGVLNLLYVPLLAYSGIRENLQTLALRKQGTVPLASSESGVSGYRRFYSTVD